MSVSEKPPGTSWKSILLPKIVLTFHCLNKLFLWSQNFCKFSSFSLKFQKFFSTTRTFFSQRRSEQFWQQNTITEIHVQFKMIHIFLSVSSTPMEITWYCLLLRMAYSYSNTFAHKCIFSRLQIREPVLKWVRFRSQCRYSSLAQLGLRPSHNKVCIV